MVAPAIPRRPHHSAITQLPQKCKKGIPAATHALDRHPPPTSHNFLPSHINQSPDLKRNHNTAPSDRDDSSGLERGTHTSAMTMLRIVAVMSLLAARRAEAQNTPSPNAPIAKPQCDDTKSVSFRYSQGSERLYVEHEDGTTRGGCVTLTEIWNNQDGGAVLFAVDPDSGDVSDTATGTWLLTEDLSIEDGITLEVILT